MFSEDPDGLDLRLSHSTKIDTIWPFRVAMLLELVVCGPIPNHGGMYSFHDLQYETECRLNVTQLRRRLFVVVVKIV